MASEDTRNGGSAPPRTVASPWVNVALRALDTTVSASQQMLDGADRLARAGAAAPTEEPAPAPALGPALWGGGRAALAYGMAVAGALQRSTIGLFTEGWRQWLGAMGTIASAASRTPAPRTLSNRAAVAAWPQAVHATASATSQPRRRKPGTPSRPRGEHATAAAGTKRRASRKQSARRAR